MLSNIESQYDTTVDELMPYWHEATRARRTITRFFFRHPLLYQVAIARGNSGRRELWVFKSDIGQLRKFLQIPVFRFSTADQETILTDLLSPEPVHAIAEMLITRHPGFDFDAIKKLHDARRDVVSPVTTTQVFFGVAALLTFIGKTVSKPIVEHDLGWSFDSYQRGLFYVTCLLLGYFGLAALTEWRYRRMAVAMHDFFGVIIGYVEIANHQPEPNIKS